MADAEEKTKYVKVEGADVFFYCDVTVESVLELCMTIKKVENDRHNPIYIHINSNGGDLHAGLGCLDFIKSLNPHIVTIVEGMCASAATFIFLGGDERRVLPNSYILIHQLGTDFWGKYDDLKDEMRQCEKLMKHMKNIYLKETTIPEEKLNKLMKRDLYLSYRKCVRYCICKE